MVTYESWDRSEELMSGMYLGTHFYLGRVRSSRVKYGGKVQHTVDLLNPIVVFGEERNTILVEEEL